MELETERLKFAPLGEFWSQLAFEVVEDTQDQDKRAVWVMEAPLV